MAESNPEPEKGRLLAGVPFAEYRAAAGINQSGLKALLHSPARYRYLEAHQSKPSPAAELGTQVHLAVLEPDRFAAEMAKAPDFASKAGTTKKGQLEEWLGSLAPGVQVVTALQMAKICGMREAVMANPKARQLFEAGQGEASMWWDDTDHGVLCKGRADFVSAYAGGCVLDLKTATSATEHDFGRAVVDPKLRYDLQAAHYLAAATATGAYRDDVFLFVVVSSSEPYECAVYLADEKILSLGRQWRDAAMATYAQCLRTGTWDDLPQFATLTAPAWAKGPNL